MGLFVTVSDTWLAACGYEHLSAVRLPARVNESASFSPMGTCYIATLPDGREWTVFRCRLESITVTGEPVEPETPEPVERKALEAIAARRIDSDVSAIRFYESVCGYLGGGFHPDDSFAGLIETRTGARTFPAALADTLDRRNGEAQGYIAAGPGLDQYEIGLALLGHDMDSADYGADGGAPVPACLAAFPDYDSAALVRVAASYLPGFVDSSWHNDTTPKLIWTSAATEPERGVVVWIEYENPDLREVADLARFTVCKLEDWDQTEAVCTESLADAIEAARRMQAETQAETGEAMAESLYALAETVERKAGDPESRAAARKALAMVAERLDGLDLDAIVDAETVETVAPGPVESLDALAERAAEDSAEVFDRTEARARRSHWDVCAQYPVEDWKLEVENDETRQSYADWVESRREAEAEDKAD